MIRMATQELHLRRGSDGYYRTSWYDDRGQRHNRSFGNRRGQALNAFATFRAEWKSDPTVRNPTGATPITIQEGWDRFELHATAYYRRADGTPTGEAYNLRVAMAPVLELYGSLPAGRFGPKALRAVQSRMVEADLCVNVINQRIRKIRHVFKWLASQELIAASVWHGLQTVPALAPGRTEARTTDPVKPAPEDHIWKVCDAVTGPVAAMIKLQYWSACRPTEACELRPIDLDTTGRVWIYSPQSHKTAHRRRTRQILIGPQAQAAIKPYLSRDLSAYCFSPLESLRERWTDCATHRHQAVKPPRSTRRVRDHYDRDSYRRAIATACRHLDLPVWSPNQLRHNALTRIRKDHGLEVAAIIAGHAKADVTQVYAEADLKLAKKIIERVG